MAATEKDAIVESVAAGPVVLPAADPPHPQFKLLSLQASKFREAAQRPWTALSLPTGTKKLQLGDSAAAIGEMRRSLQLLGDASSADSGDRYDSTLFAAVTRFQARHGLKDDGVVGAAFLAELNVPPAERLRTIQVNLERLRALPAPPPEVLLVNIPEFRLHIFEQGRVVSSMDVVVGAKATGTVIFNDTLSRIVFSPSWRVPASIVRNEIMPAMRKNPDYLASQNMEIIGGSNTLPDIRQRPGPFNALGGVKFLFPNSHDIYMHDTPTKSHFARVNRATSHGCIRVSRPAELAEYLLRGNGDWPAERIAEAMSSGRETPVELTAPLPVMIGYFTAWVDSAGRLNFRDDIYGHDKKIAAEFFADSVSAAPDPQTRD